MGLDAVVAQPVVVGDGGVRGDQIVLHVLAISVKPQIKQNRQVSDKDSSLDSRNNSK